MKPTTNRTDRTQDSPERVNSGLCRSSSRVKDDRSQLKAEANCFERLTSRSKKNKEATAFHLCCKAFGIGSDLSKYGHWYTTPTREFLEGNSIESQSDLDEWVRREWMPEKSDSIGRINVYCNPKKRQMQSMKKSELLGLLFEIVDRGEARKNKEGRNAGMELEEDAGQSVVTIMGEDHDNASRAGRETANIRHWLMAHHHSNERCQSEEQGKKENR